LNNRVFESGAAYDNFMGRYSTRLAPLFADFAGVRSGASIVDVGAGTGALAGELVRRGASVAAADPSPAFVQALQTRLPEVDVHTAPAEELPWEDERFDAALAQLVVAFMSDATKGVAEMRRVTKPGGAVAVCMWDRQGMEMLHAVREAQAALGSGGPMAEHMQRYRTREEIETLFADGFADVTSTQLEVESSYSGYDEFWEALSGGVGPAGAWVATLSGDAREAARDEVFSRLGGPTGPFTLRGRAWATSGTRA
jgi:ubiquinone/menaquinone biosynthesis C-methylase UbiE